VVERPVTDGRRSEPRVANVLADRYASPEMVAIWAPEAKVRQERELWLAVLRAQADLGLDVPEGAIDDYRAVVGRVDLEAIRARERVTRHDVKARVEEFNALAGHELVHLGLTSRDLTENVEQLQVRRALELVHGRLVAVLARLAERALEHADVVMAARTHNVPAQPTTLGKRFASIGEEVLQAEARLAELLARYPLRGLKGPVGTQADLLELLGDSNGGSPTSSASPPPSARSARSTPARWTSTWCPPCCRRPPGPATSRSWCGSWPATNWPPKGSAPGRSARRPCPTR
jgi:adenylosuccinate lyase